MELSDELMPTEESDDAKWYVAHTYSGYENKVKANIEATVVSKNMESVILEVVVPVHDVEETKSGVRKIVSKKIFPGYVLIKMYMTDESWYVVRNTRGVTDS
jgi:transcriptional antiterminator NusG